MIAATNRDDVLEITRHNVRPTAILRNAGAGLLATGTMSLVMAGAKASGLMRNPPPKHITKRAAQKVGLHPRRTSKDTFTATWLAAHVAYGMGSGVMYGLVRSVLPRSPWISGLVYGGALWGISYLGVMPVLGLYPFPDDDSNSRIAVMLAAHAVYGETLANAADDPHLTFASEASSRPHGSI